jgi:RNA-directed DNA polymerase
LLHESVTAARLRSPTFWDELLVEGDGFGRRRWRKLGAYRALLDSGEVGRMVAEYSAGTLSLRPPRRRLLNKADGRKKVIFTFAPADELLLKALNRILQATTAISHSRLCHSFQPGRGPRTAYRHLRTIPGLNQLCCLHVDVRDYFNSIPVDALLTTLPSVIADDPSLNRLLSITLRDSRVLIGDAEANEPHKGVMAGTPLAPILSNLYLRPLDDAFERAAVPYVRYADDIVVFGNRSAVEQHRYEIESRLAGLGLELNHRKTRLSGPGEPWEFLGLKYDRGSLDVAPNTAAKLRRRARRIARRARGRPDPAQYAVRKLNRRLFGVGGRVPDFTWASWFFPLLTGDATLRRLDATIQEQLRFAVTGVHERRNFSEVSYNQLRGVGYLPLVSAYHAFHRRPGEYQALLAGCMGRPRWVLDPQPAAPD